MAIEVKPIRLAGHHVVLEPMAERHVDGLYDIGREEADWAYLPISGFQSRKHAASWVEQALEFQRLGQHCPFVLTRPGSGQVMGSSRYLAIRPRDHGLEIGYSWLGKAFQRTAVNTEAKYLLLRHAFESIGVYRVEFKTDLRNVRSQRAIERLGAQREGVFRRHMVAQGGYIRDSVYYSITDLDWPRVKEGLETKLSATREEGV